MNQPIVIDILNNRELVNKIKTDLDYATDLYRSFCNVAWYRANLLNLKDLVPKNCCDFSWRGAASVVANIRNQGEGYLDFYCSRYEGRVTNEIKADLLNLGWVPVIDGALHILHNPYVFNHGYKVYI